MTDRQTKNTNAQGKGWERMSGDKSPKFVHNMHTKQPTYKFIRETEQITIDSNFTWQGWLGYELSWSKAGKLSYPGSGL